MKKVLHDVYEILGEIGSGGGGIVYLAWHRRLNKQVILKQDKREHVSLEEMRREVDLLKNLHHPSIPQVYDFVQEDGKFYTVEEYISGVSLDKILKSGASIPQSKAVDWLWQLSDALRYLHSVPPYGILHGDIKPSNIIVRDDGRVFLIDFNISLMLQSNAAFKIGSSASYASPEHYGYDIRYIRSFSEYENGMQTPDTVTLTRMYEESSPPYLQGREPDSRKGLIDKRSDIYSLGAAFYHVLSGQRPSRTFEANPDLRSFGVSASLADIIEKAMQYNPDERYQTMDEMMQDLRDLKKKDRRVIHLRRIHRLSLSALSLVLVIGIAISFLALKQMERKQNITALSEASTNALASGDQEKALSLALQAMPASFGLFEIPAQPEALKALSSAMGLYQLNDEFTPCKVYDLKDTLYELNLNGDESALAATCYGTLSVYTKSLSSPVYQADMVKTALAKADFTDPDQIVFSGADGLSLVNWQNGTVIWSGDEASCFALSQDKSLIAAVSTDGKTISVLDAGTGEALHQIALEEGGHFEQANTIYADPDDRILTFSKDNASLLYSTADGKVWFCDLNTKQNTELLAEQNAQNFSGGFCQNYAAAAYQKDGVSYLQIFDINHPGSPVSSYTFQDDLKLYEKDDELYLASAGTLVQFNPETMEQTERAFLQSEIDAVSLSDTFCTLCHDTAIQVYASNSAAIQTIETQQPVTQTVLGQTWLAFGSNGSNKIYLYELQDNAEKCIASYDPKLGHAEARVNEDENRLVLFKPEKFVIYDLDGNELLSSDMENSSQLYDHRYVRGKDQDILEYLYYDGTLYGYSITDGSLLYTKESDEPNEEVHETFETENYFVDVPFTDITTIYTKDRSEVLMTLPKDKLVRYASEIDGYLFMEFRDGSADKYCIVYDEELNEIAYLPNLTDFYKDGNEIVLLFDDMLGNIRKTTFATPEDLIQYAQSQQS